MFNSSRLGGRGSVLGPDGVLFSLIFLLADLMFLVKPRVLLLIAFDVEMFPFGRHKF